MSIPKGKYAWSVTVGEKGQIVIPKKARDVFHIRPGDTLLLLGDEKRGLAIPRQNAFSSLMKQIFQPIEEDFEMTASQENENAFPNDQKNDPFGEREDNYE